MGIYRRGRIWYSDLRINGKRIRMALGPNKQIAQERLGEMGRRRDAIRYGFATKDASWLDFRDKYLEYCRGAKGKRTFYLERGAVKALENFAMPSKLSQITPELLEQWKAKRKTNGEGIAGINRALRAMRAIMRTAESWGYCEKRDWSSVKLFRESKGKLLFYTLDQLRSLLSQCRGSWRTIVLLGARAGLRRSEIYWLSWDDVDLDRKRLHICPKEGWHPKDYEQRWVPMPPDLASHLASTKKSGRWVVPRLGPDVMTTYLRRIISKCGLRGSVHTLRHTFASHAAMAGVPIPTIASWLGHADIKTTMIYAHLSPEVSESQIKLLPPL